MARSRGGAQPGLLSRVTARVRAHQGPRWKAKGKRRGLPEATLQGHSEGCTARVMQARCKGEGACAQRSVFRWFCLGTVLVTLSFTRISAPMCKMCDLWLGATKEAGEACMNCST
eukprot:1136797-Pelagomonas_calceolata.AAC.4